MVDMKVDLERKCKVTHRWFPVARFELGLDAMDTAEALSKADGYLYRVVDHRWPDEPQPAVTLFKAGECVD